MPRPYKRRSLMVRFTVVLVVVSLVAVKPAGALMVGKNWITNSY